MSSGSGYVSSSSGDSFRGARPSLPIALHISASFISSAISILLFLHDVAGVKPVFTTLNNKFLSRLDASLLAKLTGNVSVSSF